MNRAALPLIAAVVTFVAAFAGARTAASQPSVEPVALSSPRTISTPTFVLDAGVTGGGKVPDLRIEHRDPPVDDPPVDDPPVDDPPVDDPPVEDPPAEDPPAEDPPAEDPPITGGGED